MWKPGALASAPNKAGPLGVSGVLITHVQFDQSAQGTNGVLAGYFSGNPSDRSYDADFVKAALIPALNPGSSFWRSKQVREYTRERVTARQ